MGVPNNSTLIIYSFSFDLTNNTIEGASSSTIGFITVYFLIGLPNSNTYPGLKIVLKSTISPPFLIFFLTDLTGFLTGFLTGLLTGSDGFLTGSDGFLTGLLTG